ncbi:hypothetical protein VTK73DRAFT_4052 [Phialemonium thermophilum]|uniref:Uncharacterized protein n=1 Tax=Phialemonium thermophilum TaxID=223376 RepID=A0ABR3VC26_9PEZI
MSLPVEERKRPAESPALDERDVKKIIQTVREAASPATSATLDDSSDYLLPVEGPQPKQKDDGTRQGDRDPGWEDFASHYWDASTMAPLSAVSASKEQDEKSREPYNRRNLDGTGLSCGNNMNNLLMMRSKAAIARLRAFKPPPFPLWDRLPVSRRAAVLMLLYADRRGDLRVVITMRAASLRSFSGM